MSDIEARYVRKVTIRIIPLLFLGILLGYIDRSNIAFAALRMNADLGLSPAAYGFAAGLFFLGYLCFEIPGTLAMARIGARRWMAFLVLCWGILSILMALVQSVPLFFGLRFLLGVTEAGFFPGTILYMRLFVPRHHQARLGGQFMTAVPFAMVVGGPVSGLLMQWEGVGGLHGWQWMLLAEGAPCLLLAALFAKVLADRPETAPWLDADDRAFIAREKAQEIEDVPETEGSRWRILLDPRLALLCTVTFGGPAVATGITFWLPQVLAGFGLTVLQAGMLSALPFAVAGISLWWWGAHSDRMSEYKWHLTLPLAAAALGLLGSLLVITPGAKLGMLLVASLGMFSYLPVAWSASHRLFDRASAPIGYGVITMSGAVAGFIAPIMLGLLRQITGTHEAGILALAAIAAAAAGGGFAFGTVTEHEAAPIGGASQPA